MECSVGWTVEGAERVDTWKEEMRDGGRFVCCSVDTHYVREIGSAHNFGAFLCLKKYRVMHTYDRERN